MNEPKSHYGYENFSILQHAHIALQEALPYIRSMRNSRDVDIDQWAIDNAMSAINRIQKWWYDHPETAKDE